MCGIAGLFLPEGTSAATADIDAMLGVMGHRGPDGTGRFTSPDRRYQTGFTRLAIIDLTTGDQPIVENDGRRVLVGNGEIYNYVELRRTYPDFPYGTQGDMETILPLDSALGDEFVHCLNGMFALALYDRDRHRLLLARDRLGIKPLYWARAAGGIVYASEIKALFASGLVAPAVDENSVSSYLAHGYVPAPGTLYRGVNKLPPGHMLVAERNGDVRVTRYWRALPADDLPTDTEGIRRHLTDILRDSVRLRLRSDVPLGALLSGGLDSGLIVALAAQQMDQPLNTFTVRFQGAAMDESPLAALVAERYGTNHTVMDLAAGDVAAYLPRLAWVCDEPLNDPALLPNHLIEEILGSHLKVALNGTGGDELFAGYGRYFRLPVERRYLALPRWLRQGLIEPAVRLGSPMTAWQLARAGKFHADRGGYLHDHGTHFPPPLRALIENNQAIPAPAQAAYLDEFDGPADTAALYADLNTYLPEDLLTLLDRTSMGVSVEGRVPFLDHRMVEAALAVPPHIRAPGGRQKALERAMAADFLPGEILNAPKQGFASPVPAWLEAGLAPLAKRMLTRPATLERGWWSARGIDRLLADPKRHGFRVYSLLMLELALRLHVEGPATTDAPMEGLEAFADAA
jgi:asparagine synthase (glutamine-hydrolysing)